MVIENVQHEKSRINPFFIMSFLYLVIGLLAAVQSSLINYRLIENVQPLAWVRIHFVTLGVMTQIIFGGIPYLVAKTTNIKSKWDVWIFLNSGLITFFYGRSILNDFLMIAGGTFAFVATLLFFIQIAKLKQPDDLTVYFYLVGSFYFLVGIIIGTGIWVGYNVDLSIGNALEAHIHANNWGFMALVFSGIIIDQFPAITGTKFDNRGRIKLILALQSFGAFGLVLAPWIGSIPITVIGMVSFITGTIVLLLDTWKPLQEKEKIIGHYHILLAYVWILLPLLIAPFVLFQFNGFEFVEPNAPQALIYGWVLQFGFAIVPYFLSKWQNMQNISLGGDIYSLILVNLGGLILWIGIFTVDIQETLFGIAYVLWAVSIIPILLQSYKIVNK